MTYPWNQELWETLGPRDRLPPQPLLLSGPRGVGKGAFARSVARWLLCEHPQDGGRVCNACTPCRLFVAGTHPDHRELQPATAEDDNSGAQSLEATGKRPPSSRWIRVDQVRDLSEFLTLAPHYGARKTIVILDADRLHPSAANALLKTLEEPLGGRHFLLVTHRPQRILPTVRSRCLKLQFRLPGKSAALEWLQAQQAHEPAHSLALAGGAPLEALCLDAAEYRTQRRWLTEQVLRSPDFDPVQLSGEIEPEALPGLLTTLQRWCYDLLRLQLVGDVRYNTDCAQILHRGASQIDLNALLVFMRELQSSVRLAEHPLNTRLVVERSLIGYRSVFVSHR